MSVQTPFPSEPPEESWGADHDRWQSAAEHMTRQYPEITLFQTKVLYVTGMTRHMLEASGHALSARSFFFPAYLLASGAVELLGRCVLDPGEPTRHGQRALRRGLERMIHTCPHCGQANIHGTYSDDSWQDDDQHIVLAIADRDYSIGYCKDLRNYMAHGMASLDNGLHFTKEFLGRFICKACRAIDRHYELLRADTSEGVEMRRRLAGATITPIWDDDGPIHIAQLYDSLLEPPFAAPCGSLLYEEEWRRYCT